MEPIGDPVLLAQVCGAVHDEFTCLLVVSDSGLHLHCIITIAKFSEAEAANCLQLINLIEEVVMSTVMEG